METPLDAGDDLTPPPDRVGRYVNGGMALNKIPTEGVVVARGPFRDGGTPGYSVTCWRGDS